MAMASPEEIAAKWANRLSAATPEITAGVNRVTEAPGAKAAAKVEKWKAGLAASVDKWRTNVGAVSLEQWRTATIEKGVGRISAGAQAAQGKMAEFQREFQPHLQAGLAKINAMPDTTLEDRINKAAALARHNATFRRRR